MTRKLILTAILILIFASVTCADSDKFDVAGTWLIKGVGHVDKSFVRSQLELSGYMNLRTSPAYIYSEDIQMLESYDIYLRIDATGLNIKVYDENITNGIKISVPIPTRIPTASYPLELPEVKYEDLTYRAKITGPNSGILTIQGIIRDVDVIGDLELDSDSKIWRAGTPEPDIDEGKSSGCNSGIGLAFMMLVLGVKVRVRN